MRFRGEPGSRPLALLRVDTHRVGGGMRSQRLAAGGMRPCAFLLLAACLSAVCTGAVPAAKALPAKVTAAAKTTLSRPQPKIVGKRGEGFWSVKGIDFYDSHGNKVYFSGVIWSGFETPDAVPHGLEHRSIGSHLNQMKSLGFNMIRLPFAGDTLKPTTIPTTNIYSSNPDLWGKTSLQVMDKIIEGCKLRGIKVILDYHRIHLTSKNEWGGWFDSTSPESTWIGNWVMLAKRYKGNPTVIGADLFNEVHPGPGMPKGAPYWAKDMGKYDKYNFRRASLAMIREVHPVEPNWIFFLEGMWNGYWWGGNCAALEAAPINWPPNKIAYSSHEYGPYVYPQGWFFAKDFPRSLRRKMWKMWGYLIEDKKRAVWVGEFGSFYPKATNKLNRAERIAFDDTVAYIKKLNASWTIAFWNPNSKDTGGILMADYKSIHLEKYQTLKQILRPNFGLA